MKRALAFILIAILAILVFITSPKGLQFSVALMQRFGPGLLSFQSMSGHLFKNIEASNINYSYHDFRLHIDYLNLHWSPLDLFEKKIRITSLRLNGVTVYNPSATKQTSTKSAPKNSENKPLQKLPFTIDASNLNISNLQYSTQKQQVAYDISHLKGQMIVNKHDVHTKLNISSKAPYKINAALQANGPLQYYEFTSVLSSKYSNVHINGIGGLSFVKAHIQPSRYLNGKINGEIKANWKTELTWETKLTAEKINFRKLHRNLPNSLSFKLNSVGNKKEHNLNIDQLHGSLYKHAIQGQLHLHYVKPKDWLIKTNLSSPLANFNIQANLNHLVSAKWNININQLSSIYPSIQGSLISSGSASGSLTSPNIKLQMNARNLHYLQQQVQSLHILANLHLFSNRQSTLTIHANTLAYQKLFADQLNASIKGTMKQQNINLFSNSGTSMFYFNAQGGVKNSLWSGKISRMVLSSQAYGNWRLQKPWFMHISPQHIDYTLDCWISSKGKICSGLNWDKNQQWHFNLNSLRLHSSVFNSWLPSNFSLHGPISTKISAEGTQEFPSQANLLVHSDSLLVKSNQRNYTLQLSNNSLKANYAKHQLKANLNIDLPQHNYIRSALQAQQVYSSKDPRLLPFTTSTQIHIKNLNLLEAFLSELSNLQGSLETNLQSSGTLFSPNLNGRLQVKNLAFSIPTLGTAIASGNFDGTFNQHQLSYKLNLKQKNGVLSGSGSDTFWKLNNLASLKLSGSNFLLMNNKAYQIYVNPKLQCTLNNNLLNVTGKLSIPKAKIKITDTRSVTRLPTDDIVYVHENNQPLLSLKLDTSLHLGDAVSFAAYGLQGNLTGDVKLQATPGQATIANGNINLANGYYKAYGQKLKLTQAVASFSNSPITNPSLNVTAIRNLGNLANANNLSASNNLEVGIRVTGSLDFPVTTLFSSPVMLPQTEILSYLLLGNAHSAGSSAQLSLAVQALGALHLGSSQIDPIQQVKDRLGIAELGVENETTLDDLGNTTNQQTSFVVGKYITPSLYLRYSSALNTNLLSLQLQYFLSNHWSLQTESSTEGQGGDILYSFSTN